MEKGRGRREKLTNSVTISYQTFFHKGFYSPHSVFLSFCFHSLANSVPGFYASNTIVEQYPDGPVSAVRFFPGA